jgi:hypothetical protein
MSGMWLWPLAFYAAALLIQTGLLRSASGRRYGRVAPLIMLTHLLYGAGFWRGLFTRPSPPSLERSSEITLEHVSIL